MVGSQLAEDLLVGVLIRVVVGLLVVVLLLAEE